MSVRWQHCIDHEDTKQKPANVARLTSRRSSAADQQSVKRDYKIAGISDFKMLTHASETSIYMRTVELNVII